MDFYQRVQQAQGLLCFDLEDSLQGPNPATTLLRKAERRRAIAELCQTGPYALGLRLNAPNSPHYAADVALLRELPPLHCVFVPKIEQPAALQQVLEALPDTVRSVVPVVESVAGFANLAAVLAVQHPAFSTFAFGHCDYNLSAGHFPFHHHDSPVYWAWVAALDAQARYAGKQLLNSPVLQLDNDAAFRQVLAQARTFASISGQVTLCLTHTWLCNNQLEKFSGLAEVPALPAEGHPVAARRVVRQFEAHRLPATAFAIGPQRELISPHEYAAARRVLFS